MQKALFCLFLCITFRSLGQSRCDSLFAIADTMYVHGNVKATIAIFDTIIANQCGKLSLAFNNRGFCYNETGQYEEAMKDFNSALKQDSAYASVYANKSITYSNLGNYAMAIQCINTAIKLDAGNDYYMRVRGDIRYSREKYDSAIIDYKKSLLLNPRNLALYTHIARTYERLMHTAFTHANKAANNKAAHPDPEKIGIALSTTVYEARDSAAAILTLLISRNPANKLLIYNRAEFYRRNFLYGLAIPDYLQGLKDNGDDDEMLCNLAVCYDGNGDKDSAFMYYAKSIAVKPNAIAYANRGRMYKKAGQIKEAMADEKKAIAVDPTYARAYLILGNCYVEQEDFVKAKACFKKGLEQQPEGETKDLLEIRMQQLQ